MKGKFLIDRKIFKEDLWKKPPYFIKVWIWLIGRVNWKTVERGGKVYKEGEIFTNYKQIQKETEWKVGFRTEHLTKSQIFYVLDFLMKSQRSKQRRTTRGLWIKVINYRDLQGFNSHEANNEANMRQTHGKHDKRTKEHNQGKEPRKERVEELTNFLLKRNNLEELDNKNNEEFIMLLLNSHSVEEIKDVIIAGCGDKFHAQNLTNFKYLYKNFQALKKLQNEKDPLLYADEEIKVPEYYKFRGE
jgi:hypothetical protein